MKKVFVITGEYSGDIHGGKVISLLKEQNPDIIVEGIGGEILKTQAQNYFQIIQKCLHSGLV